MRSTSIWELRVLTRRTGFTCFGAPRVLPTTNPTSKIVGLRSTGDPSARTHIQRPTSISRFSARRCSSYGFSRWWSSPPGMLRPLAEERLHSSGFGCQKVVPHGIAPQSDELFFDLACRSCAKWALNLMQATVCLRSAPASERAAAQPNSLTLQPARLIQVTPPRSRCISLRHLMLAVRINSRDTFGGSRWSRNRLRQ